MVLFGFFYIEAAHRALVSWNIVANKLLRTYKIRRKNISYADDFGLLKGGVTRLDLENNVNIAIALFYDISDQLDLRISVSKCISMLLGSDNLSNRRPILKLGGVSIPVKDTVKGSRIYNWSQIQLAWPPGTCKR